MIDWQLQFTFDNFLRFSIHRLRYSTLFMSTTVCSSACRRYEPLIVAVTLSYFAVFNYYMYWLIYMYWHQLQLLPVLAFTYTSTFLPITVVFVCLLHISSLGFAVVYFALACTPYSDFFRGFVVAFQAFFTLFLLIHFVVDFLYFSSSNIICYTYILYPNGIYLLLVAI